MDNIINNGWIIRFAKGYTKRANSVNPIYYSSYDLNQKIEECEKLYSDIDLRPTFKIAPFVKPGNSDDILKERAYSLIDYTSVQILELDGIKDHTFCETR